MKKFKIFGLICCIFLLSGCSAEYNLTINNSTMEEDINAIFDKATESELASRMEGIRRTAFYNYDTRENEYYDFTKREDDSNIILNYNYQYTGNDLYKSEAASMCYYKRIVNVTDDIITISTDNQVACLYKDGDREIEDITVNIRTDLTVLENNADKVNNGVYTWYINDKNCTNKPIYIKIEKERYQESFVSQVISIIVIVVIVVIIGILIFFKALRKRRKNNKIS